MQAAIFEGRAAMRHLSRADPVMSAIIAEVGPFIPPHRDNRFKSLVRAIVFQQLAGRAAQTIFERFVKRFGRFPSPAQVLAMPDVELRRAGLSRAKTLYIKDLARHVHRRSLNFRRFAAMDDEAVIAELTRVKGIGRWTAEMFLMFDLKRPDVLAVGDLGLRNAATRAYGFKRPLTPQQLRVFGARWKPYRTVAAWYLWRSLDVTIPGGNSAAAANPPNRQSRRAAVRKRG